MSDNCLHSIGRIGLVAVVAVSLAGCRAWQADRWDLRRLRDDRATELDTRLSTRPPVVQNPFQTPSE